MLDRRASDHPRNWGDTSRRSRDYPGYTWGEFLTAGLYLGRVMHCLGRETALGSERYMTNLKRLHLRSDASLEYAQRTLESGMNVQLYFGGLSDFLKCFNKFSSLLYAHADQIKSLYAPSFGSIFEDTVRIISELEDKLEIEIDHVAVDSYFMDDIKSLCEFYVDDLSDGSLTLEIACESYNFRQPRGPIESITFIESNRYNGVTIGLEVSGILRCYMERPIRHSLMPYMTTVYYNSDTSDYEEPRILKEYENMLKYQDLFFVLR